MVFWDTTSTYFEGKGPAELGHFGYSKDHRSDRVQVMIGVVITQTGIPIRGMVSKEILDELDRSHIEYIVGMRMRKVNDVSEVLKTGGRYKIVRNNLKVKEVWY